MVHIGVPVAFLAFASLVSGTLVDHRARTVTIPISKKVGTLTAAELIAKEKSRISSFGVLATTGTQPIINEDVVYVTPALIGDQNFTLIVDTGSANILVGAQASNDYVPSSSSTDTGDSFSVTLGSGSFSGEEYCDKVTLGGLTVLCQWIGDISTDQGFSGVDGIFGFGPVDLTEGTVQGQTTVPTFMDNLYSQGTIATEVLGVYFHPESGSDTDDTNGELTLGGTDSTKFIGTLSCFPKSTTSPYSLYWGVTVASVTYGTTTLATSVQAIVDTGTTLIYIPTSAYNSFLSATGGSTDPNTGLARFSTQPTGTFTIKLGSVSYPLTPAQYLIPQAQYSVFGLDSRFFYAWINDGGSVASNINFIIGQKFLENYYSVYDTTNSRLCFATRA
ncbi:hypothetical protein BS47DRAFT_963107 [Hydnum rufescens UP504]|uniref:Peptidase A1 domain-containing protein n=1 Tax=Hydnum rufescens UP504 TaxID=1448309 RepID=A0A9P6DSS2_9AGAM|nr:hypothetical protein BS47DRAFT_963107 [Hydnum rufescens UP504]